jgi:hypothetical protein
MELQNNSGSRCFLSQAKLNLKVHGAFSSEPAAAELASENGRNTYCLPRADEQEATGGLAFAVPASNHPLGYERI